MPLLSLTVYHKPQTHCQSQPFSAIVSTGSDSMPGGIYSGNASAISEFSYEMKRWIMVWGIFVYFAIFGFTEESRNKYRAILQSFVHGLTVIVSRPSSNGDPPRMFWQAWT
jgi:hypothetical protein